MGIATRLGIIAVLGLVFGAAALGGTGRATEHQLWQAVYRLDDRAAAPDAAAELKKAGAQGLAVLLQAARMTEDNEVLTEAIRGAGCEDMIIGAFYGPMGSVAGARARKAAGLAGQMLASSWSLTRAWLRSQDPMKRKLAVIGLLGFPEKLVAHGPEIVAGANPDLLKVFEAVTVCAGRALAAENPKLAMRIYENGRPASAVLHKEADADTCSQPADWVAGLLPDVMAGEVAPGGWTGSGGDLRVRLRMGDGTETLVAPTCALALYDAAAEKGRRLSGLLVPMVDSPGLEAHFSAAVERLRRDLERYQPRERNDVATKLVHAGVEVDHRVTFDPDRAYFESEQIEAAAMQGNPDAERAILDNAECKGAFTRDRLIVLLVHVERAKAVARAAELLQSCPEATAGAVVVLLHHGDQRALEHLGAALDYPGFLAKELEAVIRANYDRDIDAELKRLVREGREYDQRRRLRIQHHSGVANLLKKLRKDGVALP